ncbi:MAG: 16S rRNA (guanine(527)-N(7))-methyltransferase RsmG [Gammaproteobacteria bacterium]|nr:16S rRNA (guanine(527)-N(7))-methyltransferase RsmG [Gammaproteobacteria bacterium]
MSAGRGGRASPDIPLSVVLAEGLQQMGLHLPDETQARMLAYIALLAKWNRAYNLTAVRDPMQMVTRHLLDSLAVLPYIKGSRVLDVGTGAGLPGIPLALALPEWRFVLLDSNRKKTRFLIQVVAELGLKNVTVETCRVEEYHPAQLFDTVISRAFAELSEMLGAAGRLCRPAGVMLAMKGEYPVAELAAMSPGFKVTEVHALHVPGLDAARHLVCVTTAKWS